MRNIVVGVILFVAFGAWSQLSHAAQPSFDCARASKPDEFAICADDRLAELDAIGSAAFNLARQRPGTAALITDVQRLLLARIACQANKLCILDQQVATLQLYQRWGIPVTMPDWIDAYRAELAGGPAAPNQLPQRVGDCAVTAITAIGDRFGKPLAPVTGDAFDPGTGVSFANGGAQVSYDQEPTIARSRIGDGVRMCLVKLPENCPPGDDRGKVYTTTNLRTGEAWTLPDSQHECGGA